MSALASAVQQFNEVFQYDLRLPLLVEDVESAAELAQLRGRADLAQELREAINLEVDA